MDKTATLDQLILRLVSGVELFRQLDRQGIAALLRRTTKSTFRADELVYPAGEDGDAMYIVVLGSFEVYRESHGERVTLASIQPGGHFGEIALIANQKRSASVRAETDAVALRLTKQGLFACPVVAARLMHNMARMLAIRLADADNEILLHHGRARSAQAQIEEVRAMANKGPQRHYVGAA